MKRSGTSEAMAPSRQTVGVTREPGVRSRVSRRRYEASRRPEAGSSTERVSVQTLLLPSLWSSTEVRLMSASPEAQRPITYQGDRLPSVYLAPSSTWIQVPGGVRAFQEATISVAGCRGVCSGEVQVAVSHVAVIRVCGSVYSIVPVGRRIATPGRGPGTTPVPEPRPRCQSAHRVQAR